MTSSEADLRPRKATGATPVVAYRNVIKRFGKDIEANVTVQYERWNIPLLKPGAQSDVTAFGQVTWYPHRSY